MHITHTNLAFPLTSVAQVVRQATPEEIAQVNKANQSYSPLVLIALVCVVGLMIGLTKFTRRRKKRR